MFVNENEIPLRAYENYIRDTHISRNVNVGCSSVVIFEELQNYATGIKFLVSQLQTIQTSAEGMWQYGEMFYNLAGMCILIEQPLVEFVKSICAMPQRKENTMLCVNNLSQLLQRLENNFAEYQGQTLSMFQLRTKVADFIFRAFHSLYGELRRRHIALESVLEVSVNTKRGVCVTQEKGKEE